MYELLRQQKNKKIFAVVDCDNFFVSCERIFRPDLRNRPVAVLSNNDGCIVSRSKEVKELGIPMGAPAFKYKEVIERKHITLFSGNFSLYADLSQRIMTILQAVVPNTYIYSIDEAFLELTNLKVKNNNYEDFCRMLRNKIKLHTNIPVSIGIAPTKTLAKVASKLAKKSIGVVDLTKLTEAEIDKHLLNFDISDIWGIGRRLTPKLQARNILTAYDYKYYDPTKLRKLISIVGEQMYLELNGISSIKLHTVTEPRKNIASTRSFGNPVRNLNELKEAVASYTAIACEKLRKQNCISRDILVYIRTSKFKLEKSYNAYKEVKLPYPTMDTRIFTKHVLNSLEKIYKSGYDYAKAGVIITHIIPLENIQESLLFQDYFNRNIESKNILQTIDNLNQRWGSGTIKLASEGVNKFWKARSLLKSPRYTTAWDEIISIKVG